MNQILGNTSSQNGKVASVIPAHPFSLDTNYYHRCCKMCYETRLEIFSIEFHTFSFPLMAVLGHIHIHLS